MKAADATKMIDEALAKLASDLEQGKSEALTRYLAVMAKFHHYSFGNIMLILSQRPDATHVAGFRTWLSMKRWVKKGEKGIVIIAPMLLKKREGEGTLEGEPERIVRFKAVYVFDYAQTDGDPLPETATTSGDPGHYLPRLQAFTQSLGIRLTNDPLPPGALGVSKGGEIRIATGLTSAREFEVLTHELAHELLHQGSDGVRQNKTVVETEAEAVAFVVCHAIGLETSTAASDYIQLFQGTKDTLAASLDRVQKTADRILKALAEEVREDIAA
jgi:antirestriction protein ArdC